MIKIAIIPEHAPHCKSGAAAATDNDGLVSRAVQVIVRWRARSELALAAITDTTEKGATLMVPIDSATITR